MTEREREEGRQLARRDQKSDAEQDREVARIREKQAEGETLTRSEAGKLGADASQEATKAERRESRREGRGEAFAKEHEVKSWTNAPGEASPPHPTETTKRKVGDIREKQARGEKLTREEAGTLGGAARAREGSKRED